MRMVIVGASTAGRSAAVTLREQGFGGDIVLIGDEPHPPYDRPQLSKQYLRGDADIPAVIRPLRLDAEHGIDTRLGTRVTRVLPEQRAVEVSGGERIAFDRLLLATGVRNRRLRLPGADLDGIHDLRDIGSSDRIREAAASAHRAVVVGMGFIGCEVAASLTQLGVHVTAIFPEKVPLERVLGEETGAVIGDFHRVNGVELLAGEQIAAFEGTEQLETAVMSNGARIPCDFAVVGVGIQPDLSACQGSAVAQENGILVDERCRTSEADVYAAGDVANILHPLFGRVRVEHYNNAEKQGRAAARSMLGSTDPYDYVYTFWSDQYEHKLEYAGYAAKWDGFVVRGSLEEGKLVGFYLVEGQLKAAVGVDRGGDPEADEDSEMAACARLIALQARPAPGVLADENVDLWELAR
jgi:3-phenylpropionate/trans-cinnamate dioxygenase ferredoxin reductase subunit